jgi:hypothetical protein
MDHAVCWYSATFTIWTDRYVQARQISENIDSFIFSSLLKQQQNQVKNIQIKGMW